MKIGRHEVGTKTVMKILLTVALISLAAAIVIALNNPEMFRWNRGYPEYTRQYASEQIQGEQSQISELQMSTTMYRNGQVGLPTDFSEQGSGSLDREIVFDVDEIDDLIVSSDYANLTIVFSKDEAVKYPRLQIKADEAAEYSYTKFREEFIVTLFHPSRMTKTVSSELLLVLPASFHDRIEVKNQGGNVNVSGTCNGITIDADYGNVKAEVPSASAAEISVYAGNLYFEGSVENGNFESEKGNIELALTELQPGSISAECDMGSISIVVPKDKAIYAKVKSGLGGVRVLREKGIKNGDYEEYGDKDSPYHFYIDCDMGSIKIREK